MSTPAPSTQAERHYITVTGRTFCYTTTGTRHPTVVFEAGAGESLETWEPIYTQVASLANVFRYDRAGLGQSDAGTTPRTMQDAVNDLHAVLHTASIPEPYVLVGHSLGGLIIRLYAHQFSSEVVGIILIDSPHPDQLRRFQTAIPSHIVQEHPVIRRVLESILESNPTYHPEGMDFAASLAQAEQASDFGSIPLVVLAHRKDHEGSILRSAEPDLPIEAALAFDNVWHELQADLATLSHHTELIVASYSGHYIHWDEPELVITAIHKMLNYVQAD